MKVRKRKMISLAVIVAMFESGAIAEVIATFFITKKTLDLIF